MPLLKVTKTTLYIVFVFLSLKTLSQGSEPIWDKDFVYGGDSEDKCMAIVEVEEDKSIISAGHTRTSSNQDITQANRGDYDFWVIKHDSINGTYWENRFGADSTELLKSILILPDGYLLAGSSVSGANGDKSQSNRGGFDYWIVKIDKNGNRLWDKRFGGDKDDVLSHAVISETKGFILVGTSSSNKSGDKSDNSNGGKDYWVLKLDALGNKLWDKTFGGTKDDICTAVYLGDGIYLNGYSDSDIGVDKSEASFGGFDYWVVKLDKNDQTVDWDKTFGGADDDIADMMVENVHSGGVILTGSSESSSTGNKTSTNYGDSDYWTIKLGPDGDKKWEVSIGGSSLDVVTDMVATPEGAVVVGGYSRSDLSGNKESIARGGIDYFIVKIDSSGKHYWDKTYGGALNDTLQSVFVKCDRGVFVGGHSGSDISGDRRKANRGDDDYWVIKLSVPTVPLFKADNHCFGQALNFNDQSNIWPDEWIWDFGDPASGNNSSTDQHPLHTFSAPGSFNVSMTVREGCQDDTTLVKTITVYENPLFNEVELDESQVLCEGETMLLMNQNSPLPPDSRYTWSTGDTVPEITVDKIGIYTLSVTSGNCTEVDSIELDDCPIIYFPNAFTPNNDGVNDGWGAKGVGIREYDLKIFNRWGEVIYETEEITEFWDGTVNGRLVQIDVYVFKCLYKGLGTQPFLKYGHITVIR